ncbi:MAG: holin family protein [Rhodocyclaceae bacterium]|nr:holin family protein [Rhodocyclaceae bacterium]
MNPLFIGGLVESVGKLADDLFTSDKERFDAEIELRRLGLEETRVEAGLLTGQQEINRVEAASSRLFVAGWRPAVGWVCVAALAYQFLLYPLLIWSWALMQAQGWIPMGLAPPPMLETDSLYVVLFGLLGIGGLRSFEKVKGVAAR